MQVQQFYDDGLAQASYAILSQGKIALVDPGRDPQPYYQFAREHQAEIVAVVETHGVVHKLVFDDFGRVAEIHKDVRLQDSASAVWAIWKFTRPQKLPFISMKKLVQNTPIRLSMMEMKLRWETFHFMPWKPPDTLQIVIL